MATEKHTPGPWHIGGIEGGCRAAIVYSQDGWAICDCKVFHGRSAVEQIQANARLIAAAPMLLSHMREAIENCDQCRRLPNASRCARCQTFMEDIETVESSAPGVRQA